MQAEFSGLFHASEQRTNQRFDKLRADVAGHLESFEKRNDERFEKHYSAMYDLVDGINRRIIRLTRTLPDN
jgi:hypothetical protein